MKTVGKKLAALSVAVSGAFLAGAVHAQTSVLPSDFNMDSVNADIITVGGVLIGLAVTAVGIKWIKATFFG